MLSRDQLDHSSDSNNIQQYKTDWLKHRVSLEEAAPIFHLNQKMMK